MNLVENFLEMLQYPNSPKVYRRMRDIYKQIGMTHESKAFSHLLEIKFKELSNDNDNYIDQK